MNRQLSLEGMAQSRRSVLALAATAGAASLTGCLGDGDDGTENGDDDPGDSPGASFPADTEDPPDGETFPQPTDPVPERLEARLVAGGLTQLTQVAFLPDSDGAYVLERDGFIRYLDGDELSPEPALDLSADIEVDPDFQFELGVLGLAFHPDFADNRRLFVRYSAPSRPGTGEGYSHTFVLAEFEASADGSEILPGTERTVLEIPQPHQRHNAGDIAFDSDGSLFVPTGDGGARPATLDPGGPGYVDDWYDTNWGGPGQNTTDTLLGGILRIDVDADPTEHHRTDPAAPDSPDGDAGYAIPEDNPLVGREGHRDEYFAWGLRNPWRIDVHEGELFVADVGEVSYESVYYVAAGGNYGWNVREGSHCHFYDPADEGQDCPTGTPEAVRDGEPFHDPIVEYEYGPAVPGEVSGIAIIGGAFALGETVPGLYGRYVFGDFFPNEPGTLADSQIYVATPPSGPIDQDWETAVVPVDVDDPAHLPGGPDPIHSIERDREGNIHVVTRQSVWRLVPDE